MLAKPITRRSVLASGMALAAGSSLPALGAPASLDPVNPDIRYGVASFIWQGDIEEAIKATARLGLQGIEPYRQTIMRYMDTPAHFFQLKQQCDAVGITLIDCANGGEGMSVSFLDRKDARQTIADHVNFARDYLAPCGCDHWKINMGRRPAGGPNDDQLKTLADTLNEIGRQTLAAGIRLAPHPHIWGPLEREHEVRRMLELTDPKYVWITTDTAHLTLGGMDAVQIISDYFPRVAEVHLKDCDRKFRGNKSTPTPEQHREASVYQNLGTGGGVDFPAVFKILRERRFEGWTALDLDPPRPNDGTGDIHDNLAININYMRHALDVKLPSPVRA